MDLWRDHTFEKLYDIHVTPILPTCYRICLLMWGSCPLSRLSGVLKQNKYLSMVSIYCCICMHLYVICIQAFFCLSRQGIWGNVQACSFVFAKDVGDDWVWVVWGQNTQETTEVRSHRIARAVGKLFLELPKWKNWGSISTRENHPAEIQVHPLNKINLCCSFISVIEYIHFPIEKR